MEIFGFKSFADRARIEFTPGITALLGPNGCGKSNVVDAIKWVLGEQASKSLRADKMEDVIFNGTDQRKALSVAEVSLTVSNERQLLALDLPEISIKRRLYRSGESEYFINNTLVRLKEVRELFYDTGVGKSAYSVMEQGRIDQILSTKPEERRYLFEEAAGITKYKARGQDAERRLEKTEENLRQLEGILGEIKHTWETLKRQADKTHVYRQIKKDLFELERDQQLSRWKHFLDQRTTTESKVATLDARKAATKHQLDELNGQLSSGLAEVTALEAKLAEIQRQLLTLDLNRSNLHQQKTLQNERLRQYQEDEVRHESQWSTLTAKLSEVRADSARWSAERTAVEQELAGCQKNMDEFGQALESAKLTMADHEATILQAENRHQLLESQDAQWQDQWRQLTDTLVQELDEKLKHEGFAWHKLPGLTASMEEALAQLRQLLVGRQGLLETLVHPAIPDTAWKPTVSQVADSLGEAVALVDHFAQEWATYRGAIPKFLEDFLSPQGIITQKRGLEERMAMGRAEMKVQKDVIRQRQADKVLVLEAIESHRVALEELKMVQVRLQTRQVGIAESLERSLQDEAALQVQLTHVDAEKQSTQQKMAACRRDLETLDQKHQFLNEEEQGARTAQASTERELTDKNQALIGRRAELTTALDAVAVLQGEHEAHQLALVRIDTEIAAIHEHFRDKHSVELSEFAGSLGSLADRGGDWKELVQEKREELRNLGQVNLLAVEEFAEINERHSFLQAQVTDLKQAREDLRRVTAEIRKESSELFSQAFAQIRENFNTTFRRLFGGGRAELRLTEPDSVLESGIEMLCQPPGKKLESIHLLSGGEKSMTAVALLFATFMVKPSPFCILDEIDAALDEANVSRFVAMLTEFSAYSQFVVITHNKKTVAGSSTMIGVTMETPGVSKILAVRLAGESNQVSA